MLQGGAANEGESYSVLLSNCVLQGGAADERESYSVSYYLTVCFREEQSLKGSRASLSSTIKLGDSDDEGSLAEYGDIDTGKFNEDGSFLGLYH